MNDEHAANLLIGEDDPQSARLLSDLLTAAGYACRVATEGDAVLDLARSTVPDLILLDVRIPGRNGFEVCERLKADARTAHIPVVMVTAFTEEQIRLRAIECGADDFLTKPVKRVELCARVRSLLRIRRCLAERETPEAVVQSLFTLIRLYDAALARHCQVVSALAGSAARGMGLAPAEVRTVEQAGLLHDLGRLTSVDQHEQNGEQVLSGLVVLSRLAPLVRRHHEQWTGGVDQPACLQVLAAANRLAHLLDQASNSEDALKAWQGEVQQGWWNPVLYGAFARAVSEVIPATGIPSEA